MKMSLDNTESLLEDLKMLLKLSEYINYDLIDRKKYQKKLKKLIKHLKTNPSKVIRKELLDE